jgi:hypothetical protein
MAMKTQLDMEKIAKGLGAERRGKVANSGGYFGTLQLLLNTEPQRSQKPRINPPRGYAEKL